nr:MAG TPA: hypothetical protein [Caudoviricetes sp.]
MGDGVWNFTPDFCPIFVKVHKAKNRIAVIAKCKNWSMVFWLPILDANPFVRKTVLAIRNRFKIVCSHPKFLLNIAPDALVILVRFGFENKVNPLFHALTSSFSFRFYPARLQSTRRSSSCLTAATKRTFLSHRCTEQADCWSFSSGSKVRCPSVLLFDMNPCNADHCIIMAFHDPTVTERHTVICSATVKAGIVSNLACLHKKFAVVVKRLSFF